jgi:hypothetical protein
VLLEGGADDGLDAARRAGPADDSRTSGK